MTFDLVYWTLSLRRLSVVHIRYL